MKTLIDTLEKFAAYNAKAKEMKGRYYAHTVNTVNGYKYASNGFYMLAEVDTTGKHSENCPDPLPILSGRANVTTKVTVNVSELEQALKNADVFARENDRQDVDMVKVYVAFGIVTLHAHSEEFGSMSRTLTTAVVSENSKAIVIAFNCDYLRNCARFHASKNETVTLEFVASKTIAYVSGNDENKIAAIMPMDCDITDEVETGLNKLYCPELPGEKSAVLPATATPGSIHWKLGKIAPSEGRFCWIEWENSQPQQGIAFREPVPASNAVECNGILCWNTSSDGKCKQYPPTLILNFTDPQPIAKPEPEPVTPEISTPSQPADPDKPTKSELMTALNHARAAIRKNWKGMPSECKKRLERLYRAFGNLQRKNWKETTAKAPRTNEGGLEWIILKTTQALYGLVTDARALNVTDEFKAIKKEAVHVS